MEFNKISDGQYVVSDKYGNILGHLIQDSKKKCGYYLDRGNVLLFESELLEIIDKIRELSKQLF